jgi:oxygen-dependent protoporphyrinogen oxidase
MSRIIIVGGGISGLSLAHTLLEKDPSPDITVLESDVRVGGKIWTNRLKGFLCEAGVNGFLDNKPASFQLARKLALEPLRSNDSARKRYIYSKGSLRMVPESPLAFFLSDFLSVPGKLRMMGEFFVPRVDKDDESLESFAVRRVGSEFFEMLLDPMASGIYAGDPSKMSIKSCFGRVYDLEQKYGGLIRGFISLKREAMRTGRKVEAGPGGTLYSFSNGMYSLINSLKVCLGDIIKTRKNVKGVEKTGERYTVFCSDGSAYEADNVVLASPAHDTAGILRDLDKPMSEILMSIPYPPISVVALGYKREKINRDTNFFGFLVPGREKRKILGTLFDSSIFKNRAPEGQVLTRTMVGGARAPKLALMDDERMLAVVRQELSEIASIKADPDFFWIYRYEKAIPQYEVGHHRKLAMLEESLSRHKGLYLAGNAYRGVAMNDCIGNSFTLAEKIISSQK